MKKIDIIKLQPTPVFAKTLNYFARGDYCKNTMLSQKCLCCKRDNEFSDSTCKECIKKWLLEKYNMDLYLKS